MLSHVIVPQKVCINMLNMTIELEISPRSPGCQEAIKSYNPLYRSKTMS